MKKHSFLFRILLTYIVLLVAEGSAFYMFTAGFLKNLVFKQTIQRLKNVASVIEPDVVKFYQGGNYRLLDSMTEVWGRKTDVRITIIDGDGRVLADSRNNPDSMENHKYRPEILKAIRGRVGISTRHSPTMNVNMLYVAIPSRIKDKNIVIRTSVFLNDVSRFTSSLNGRMGISIVLLTLLAIVFAFLIAKSVFKPIKELSEFSSRLADGDFGHTLISNRRDEIGELTGVLNEMSIKLKEIFEEIGEQRAILESILSAVPDAILLLDKNGKVIYANNVFRKNFFENPENRFYWEIPVIAESSEYIDKCLENLESQQYRIYYEERYYEVFVRSAGDGKAIVVLHDITESKKMEKMRKELVTNISHELRTPLTAIRGYIEALSEITESKDAKEYISILKKHTDRLVNITEDLLTLDELENRAFTNNEVFDVSLAIKNVVKMYEKKARSKGLKIDVDVKDEVYIRGDEIKIEQMLTNLIDNALKYTDKGYVKIFLERDGAYAKLVVEDTGIGIPEEHLDRIFERFYVVDRSRSRKSGGTGLGLSIVKHIVLLHGGRIDVKSIPGKGTKFIVFLPLADAP